MTAAFFQVPEILDFILEYASYGVDGQKTIYTCLFVNHQFQAHATRLLYRHLSLHVAPNTRKLEAENRLCRRLCERPVLALHVHSLFLNFTWTSRNDTRFAARLNPVLRSLRNLRHVKLHTSTWLLSLRTFTTVLPILMNLESRPEVSFSLSDDDKIMDDDIQEFGCPMLGIDARLPIKNVAICDFWSSTKLRFLSQFRQLHTLSLHHCSNSWRNFERLDMDTIFKDVPLTELNISGCLGALSFPRNLRSLSLDDDGHFTNSIDQVNWGAICRLRELTFLKLEFSSVHIWGDGIEFMSNLRSFEGRLPGETRIIQTILNPIFSSSSRLASVGFTACLSDLYPDFIECLMTANSGLTRLSIQTLHLTFCSFRRLLNESVTLSNLTQLTLPWPFSVEKEIEKSKLSAQQHCQILCRVPQQLTFDDCKRFAAIFPKLHAMKFQLEDQDIDTTWSRYSLRSSGTPRMPSHLEKLGGLYFSYLERFQGVKMAKLIHPSSPCLDICTFLFRFQDPKDSMESTYQLFKRGIIVHLNLGQIRKHFGQ